MAATLTTERAAITREGTSLLRLTLDTCAETNGSAPCTAVTGCRYTWATCKDTTNYNKTTRNYDFVDRGAKVVGARPLLQPIKKSLPVKINLKDFKSERGEMKFELVEDTASPKSDPTKGADGQDDTGNFWPNLIARNPNYHGRIAELYKGFAAVDSANWELEFRGIIHDINYTKNGVEVTVRDLLYKAVEENTPKKIPSDVVVDDNPLTSGAATLNLDDGSGSYTASDHFQAANTNEAGCIKIEDEYILYTGVSTDQLTGLTRGAYGTTAAAHVQSTAVTQVLIYSNDDDSAAYSSCTGVYADHIYLDLLCNHAGIGAEYISVSDSGSDIDDAGGISDADTTIGVDDASDFPEQGTIKINDELIRYTVVDYDNNELESCLRGMYGSTAAAHSDNDDIYITSFTYELGRWHGGSLYKARFEKSKKVKERIKSLTASVFGMIWQNESGEIEFRVQAPPWYSTTPMSITVRDIIDGDYSISNNDEVRITRCLVLANPTDPDPGTGEDNQTDYQTPVMHVDADAESSDNYDESRIKPIYSEWIYRSVEAAWLASHYFRLYRDAPPYIKFPLELKDETLQVGDLVRIQIAEIVDEDGAEKTDKLYRVLSKVKGNAPGRFNYEAQDSGYGGKRYGVIAPAGTNDYGSATATEKEKYVWVADTSGYVGAADDAPYLIF